MLARDHTDRMLTWWVRAGVDRADLAVRRVDGAMLWHADQPAGALPLAWARAQNSRNADVYVRPARGHPWPLVFLDDVPCDRAAAVARKYAALIVHTSAAGGCHLWLRCSVPLHENERHHAQHHLALRLGADLGSISGEHLGRLAGFKNWKRSGVWVNVLQASELGPWRPVELLAEATSSHALASRVPSLPDGTAPESVKTTDTSASGADWAFTCRLLEAGCDPRLVHARLVNRARPRRGTDAERYATHTLSRALRHLAGSAYAPAPTTRT
jgi:hypothetical protein